ncbi:MAG: methyl-accepting chemotaxis protein [Burkholderiales bacterium]
MVIPQVSTSLSSRIALYASLCAAAAITAVCLAIGWKAGASAEADALTLAQATVQQAASAVERDLQPTHALVQAFTAALTAQKLGGQAIGRDQLNGWLKAVVEQRPEWLGFYSVWAPNALDGADAPHANTPGSDATGRFLSWWNRLDGAVTVSPVVFVDKPGSNDWYDVPCVSGKEAWLDVAPFEINGKTILASTLAAPILNDKQCLGIVAVDLELGALQKHLQAIPLPIPGATLALISQRGVYVSDPRSDRLGKPADDQPAEALKHIADGQPYQRVDGQGLIHLYTPVTMAAGLPAWSIEMRLPLAQTRQSAQALLRWAAVVGLISVLLGSAVMLLLVRRTTAPLRRLADTLESLVSGSSRLNVQLPASGRDELSRIAGAFNAFVGKLRAAFGGVSAASAQVDLAASEIASGNQDLSQRTESQAIQIQSVSEAMRSLESSIHGSASEARQAAAVAGRVREQALHSAVAMSEARAAMDVLFETSRRIESIVGVIDELAAQTNILALNAGVESARAGDAGRGFAVVATEVRRLSHASTTSANDIRTLIAQATQSINQGHQRILHVDEAVRGLASAFETVRVLVSGIEQRCDAQTVEVDRAGKAVDSLDGMTQQNAALVEQAAAASSALSMQTERLFTTVSEYLDHRDDGSERSG